MKYIFTLILFFLMLSVSKAAEVLPIPAPTTPAIIDFGSYSEVSEVSEKVKLKNLAAELKKDESATVSIISYAGQYSYDGEALKRMLRAKQYLINREKIVEPRINLIDGGYREKWTVELYIVPPGASQPAPDPTIARAYVKIYRKGRVKNKRKVKLQSSNPKKSGDEITFPVLRIEVIWTGLFQTEKTFLEEAEIRTAPGFGHQGTFNY